MKSLSHAHFNDSATVRKWVGRRQGFFNYLRGKQFAVKAAIEVEFPHIFQCFRILVFSVGVLISSACFLRFADGRDGIQM